LLLALKLLGSCSPIFYNFFVLNIFCFEINFQGEADGKVRVLAKYQDGTTYSDEFDTVIFAIGRDAETAKLGLDKVSIQTVTFAIFFTVNIHLMDYSGIQIV
jgi:pyruvate/2-oxoglutarate dehydrogenase complex dihydrolipoamide dehydrogenase (E3) component